jgi:subtilase family serine protease
MSNDFGALVETSVAFLREIAGVNGLRKRIASIAALSLIAGTTLPANALSPAVRTAASHVLARTQVAGVPRSMVPSRDFGRRQPSALVTATVMLRYNREAELDALINAQSSPRSPLYHHFLTSQQFNNYFAPTPQQQAFVVAKLQAAGLRVTQSFPNRTLLDVAGTSGAAERFFGTEIHSISQGRYGARFANVRPATVPASIAPFVRYVSLSNLVIARTRPGARPH